MKLLLTAICLLAAIGYAQQGSTSAAAPAPKPKPCTAPEFRQFDFWVGTWDVEVKGKIGYLKNQQVEAEMVEQPPQENHHQNRRKAVAGQREEKIDGRHGHEGYQESIHDLQIGNGTPFTSPCWPLTVVR